MATSCSPTPVRSPMSLRRHVARVRRERAGIRPQSASLAARRRARRRAPVYVKICRMGFRRWPVVGLVVAVALSVATFTSGSAPTARADGCPDVQLIFARGTAEPPGLGAVGDALFAALQPALGSRTVDAYAVNYPASYNFLTTADGANDARDHIAAMADSVPGDAAGARWLLAGRRRGLDAGGGAARRPAHRQLRIGARAGSRPGRQGAGGCGVRQSRQPLQHAPFVNGCVRRPCHRPVQPRRSRLRRRRSRPGRAPRLRSHRPTPARRRDSSPDWCRPSDPQAVHAWVRYCENARSTRIGQRRGRGAASWRRPCRVVPRHPRRARAGLRRASQLRQGAGAGRRARFRDHRARRWVGHRLSRRLRQRTADRRDLRRIRRAARDRARLRPQHHCGLGGRAPRWRWPRWPTSWA